MQLLITPGISYIYIALELTPISKWIAYRKKNELGKALIDRRIETLLLPIPKAH